MLGVYLQYYVSANMKGIYMGHWYTEQVKAGSHKQQESIYIIILVLYIFLCRKTLHFPETLERILGIICRDNPKGVAFGYTCLNYFSYRRATDSNDK